MKKSKVKFGRTKSEKSQLTVETKHFYGQGSTKEAALLDALVSAEEDMDWSRKRIEKVELEVEELKRKLMDIASMAKNLI
jgi:hypothetical protein